MDVPEADKAYIAGLIDGEGYIGITEYHKPHRNSSFACRVIVGMSDKDAINFILSRYTGNYNKYSRPGRRDMHRFMAQDAKDIKVLLTDTQPYIRVKSIQVALALDYLRLPRFYDHQEVPEDIVERRRFYIREMQALNQGSII